MTPHRNDAGSRVMEAVKAGMKVPELARAHGVHRCTVFLWLADFYERGLGLTKFAHRF